VGTRFLITIVPPAGQEVTAGTDLAAVAEEVFTKLPGLRDAVSAGNRYHDAAVATALAQVQFPAHFVDFETFMPALPVFVGTHPYQTIPFQWSDHVLPADGQVRHCEFLHDGSDDPRRRFAETLLDAVSGGGSIVVYSRYEEFCLRELEAVLPELALRLASALKVRALVRAVRR
jgi:hypothetical protein